MIDRKNKDWLLMPTLYYYNYSIGYADEMKNKTRSSYLVKYILRVVRPSKNTAI